MKILLIREIEYENIKNELLKSDDIDKVIADKAGEKFIITPNVYKNYNWMEEPLDSFKERGKIKICNKNFNIVKYYENMGKVYELVLKEHI